MTDARRLPTVLLAALAALIVTALVPVTATAQESGPPALDLEFTWVGDPPAEARTAMLEVEDRLAAVLGSPIPLRVQITWEPGEENTLATAGATGYLANFDGAPREDIEYPVTIASVLAGEDLAEAGTFHVESNVNADLDWDFRVGVTDADSYDFIGTMLHEVLHGLGFFGNGYCEEDRCTITGDTGFPGVFDSFIVVGEDDTPITQLEDESDELRAAMTSDAVFWDGPLGVAAARSPESGTDVCGDGDDACPTRPKIHAPSPYEAGSSMSHWDETTYPSDTPNAMMTAAGDLGETAQDVGPMTAAVLREIGWPAPAEPRDPVDVNRLAGDDRERTAIAVSRAGFPNTGSADTVVLARADEPSGFADALAGAPLAAEMRAPLLLTSPTGLSTAVREEIDRVLVRGGKVLILGGTSAITPEVEQDLASDGHRTERIAGGTRFDTAVEVAERLADPTTVFLATGLDFPDALAASAAAVHVGGAVLLVGDGTRAPATDAWLDANRPTTTYAVGGPAVRSHPEATPIAGGDRVATSVAVATLVFDAPTVVGVARSDRFPDALAGGAHVGALGGPVVLTSPDALSAGTLGYVCDVRDSVGTAFLYGGTVALDGSIDGAVREAVDAGTGC